MKEKPISNLFKTQQKMKQKENQLKKFNTKVKTQIEQLKQLQKQRNRPQWGISVLQKRIQNQSEISNKFSSSQKKEDTFYKEDTFNTMAKAPWDYYKSKDLIHTNICNSNKYYPPSCSGYDITYSKLDNSIYVYGGISCQTVLEEGIKTFFYKYSKEKWSEIKPESMYCPIPRYGHTLTCYQRDLILFGGVSEYKQKLKDRCFYSDISVFNTQKNQWRILQTTGNFAKTRKNHATCIFNKFLFIYGGINQNQQVISDLSWISLQQRKPRWKTITLEARFNHKMISIQTKGRQFLAIFGGRNQQSQIISSLRVIPISVVQGQIHLKDPISIPHQISARQMPVVQRFSQGFIILGGNNQDNQVVSDSWYYHAQKQCFEKLQFPLDFQQLRGCQGVSMSLEKVYILGCNSKKYKAVQIQLQR